MMFICLKIITNMSHACTSRYVVQLISMQFYVLYFMLFWFFYCLRISYTHIMVLIKSTPISSSPISPQLPQLLIYVLTFKIIEYILCHQYGYGCGIIYPRIGNFSKNASLRKVAPLFLRSHQLQYILT